MKKEMLINVLEPEETRIAILEDGVLEELYIERVSNEGIVGNIYRGRIVNIEPSIQAAFVDFGIGRNGFLHISDVDPAYYEGQRNGLLGQIERGDIGRNRVRGERQRTDRDRDRDQADDSKAREDREPRDQRSREPRESREPRSGREREPQREQRDRRDRKEPRERYESREREQRAEGERNSSEFREQTRREPRDQREREQREPRDQREREPRDQREREPREERDRRPPQESRESREPRQPQRGEPDRGRGRDRGRDGGRGRDRDRDRGRDRRGDGRRPPEPPADLGDDLISSSDNLPDLEDYRFEDDELFGTFHAAPEEPTRRAPQPPPPAPQSRSEPRPTPPPAKPLPIQEDEDDGFGTGILDDVDDQPPKVEPQTGFPRRIDEDDESDDFGSGLLDDTPQAVPERPPVEDRPLSHPSGETPDVIAAPEPREQRFEDDSPFDSWDALEDEPADAPIGEGATAAEAGEEAEPGQPKRRRRSRRGGRRRGRRPEGLPAEDAELAPLDEPGAPAPFAEPGDQAPFAELGPPAAPEEFEDDDEEDDDEDDDDFDEYGPRDRRGPRGGGRRPRRNGSMSRRPRHRPPIQEVFRRGQEVLVQVIKEGIGNKGPTLSTYISIPGRHLVLMPGLDRVGVSRKILDLQERRRLRQIVLGFDRPENVGFIVRTAGVERDEPELERDLAYLLRLWEVVSRRIKSQRGPGSIYQESDMIIRTIRDIFTPEIDAVYVDEPAAFERTREFLQVVMPQYVNRLKEYNKPEPLFHNYGIEEEIAKVQKRTVPLPQGGSIVIEQAEALVAIDVNSGNFRADDNAEETAYRMNLAAAKEIARQLRLRDMGGVIVNDFIDMREERHRRGVERALREAVERDRARTKILRMSAFGLIEMTRQRIRPSLRRSLYRECPACNGTGLCKTIETLSIDCIRLLNFVINKEKVARVDLKVDYDLAEYLQNKKRKQLAEIERRRGAIILIEGREMKSPERIDVTCYDSGGRELDIDTKLPEED